LPNQNTVELLEQWNNFTSDRETERHRLMNPPGVEDKKAELDQLTQQMAELKGRIGLLKAEITVAKGSNPYNRALFDVQWSKKRAELKEAVEKGFSEELKAGKSVPAILVEYNMNNPVWLYKIKDKLKHQQEKDTAKLSSLQWAYSDFTGTQRFALARNEDGAWQYGKMKGALGSDLEGEEAVWDISTGDFISGSYEVFEATNANEREKRIGMLQEVLAGVYTGAYKASPNPYFGD
jgi:hypothetical protein